MDSVYNNNLGGAGLECQQHVDCPSSQQENVTWSVPSITVNLTNRCLENYCRNYSEFQLSVAHMGNRFVDMRSYSLSWQISPENVLVRSVEQCSVNATACVQIEFGLPVNISSQQGPQLDVNNLRAMWDTFATEFFPQSACYEDYTCQLPSSSSDIESIDVWLASDTCLEVYCDDHSDFRSTVAEMVWKFNGTANSSVNHNISNDDVAVMAIKQCTIQVTVPCVQFTFGLILNASNQLTSFDLQRMWEELAPLHFPNVIIQPIEEPTEEPTQESPPSTLEEESSQWYIALIVMGVILICFSIILFLLRKLAFRLKGLNEKKWKSEDSPDNKGDHQGSRAENIDPHSLQTLPSFFESDYPYYEPSLTGANQRISVLEEPINVNRESMFAPAERNPSDPVPNRPHSYVNT